MDRLVPPLAAGEYGKMPASFYENSQRVAPTAVDDEAVEGPPVAEPPRESENVPDASAAAQTESRPARAPLLPRDKWDGVDSDDETDEEDSRGDLGPLPVGEEDEEEDERPQVVGEVEIDMEDEQDEFLEFAREALGISDEMWRGILRERLDKGGTFVITFPIRVVC